MLSRLAVYGENLRSEMMVGAPLFALVGLYACIRSPSAAVRRASVVLSLSCVVYVLVFHKLANLDLRPLFLGVQARFWQQCNFYIYLYAGIGVKFTADSLAALVKQQGTTQPQRQQPSASASSSFLRPASLLALLVCTSSLGLHLYSNFHRADHSATDSFYKVGVAMLESFPPNSLVLLNGDLNHNLLKYPNQCEGVRPDLSLVSLQLMSWDWWVPMQRHHYQNVTIPGVR